MLNECWLLSVKRLSVCWWADDDTGETSLIVIVIVLSWLAPLVSSVTQSVVLSSQSLSCIHESDYMYIETMHFAPSSLLCLEPQLEHNIPYICLHHDSYAQLIYYIGKFYCRQGRRHNSGRPSVAGCPSPYYAPTHWEKPVITWYKAHNWLVSDSMYDWQLYLWPHYTWNVLRFPPT